MKTIGIAADNYKLEKFLIELSKKGFNNIEIVPLPLNVSLLRISCSEDQVSIVHAVCVKVEAHFNRKN